MVMLLFNLLLCALVLNAAVAAPAQLLPRSSKQISPDVLDCSSSNALKRALCTVVQTRLNASLAQAGIRIERQALLFSYEDRTTQHIDTGHSCSVTAQLRAKKAHACFVNSAELDFDFEHGATVSEPLVLSVRVPIELEADAEIKQSFGVKVFGRCRRLGSDTFTVEASLATNANVVIALTLNPAFHTRASGEFVVSVKPVAAVMFGLEQSELDFEVRGLSLFTALAGPLLGFTSSLSDGVKDLFNGRGADTIARNFEQSALYDLGIPLLARLDNLPRPATELVYDLLSDVGERELESRAQGFGSDFEQVLNSKIREAIIKTVELLALCSLVTQGVQFMYLNFQQLSARIPTANGSL